MEGIKLTIDGIAVDAVAGQTVLEAALAADIYIPHLCTHPDLSTQGGCKLCVVEIDGETKQSCQVQVEPNMHVITKSDNLKHRRTVAMELMLAGHPHDCTGCKMYLKCELQSTMQYLGTVHARLRDVHKKTTQINTENPLIVREMERCIQCGRCVRACRDLRGVGVYDFKKCEGETYIGTQEDMPLGEAGCRFCGACIEVCPTGALQDAAGIFRSDLPREQALVPCQAECPAGIDIPAFLRAIDDARPGDAVGILRERVPFPHALGYVCNARCEGGCKRSGLNSAVAIRELKRYAVEADKEQRWLPAYQETSAPTGKRVAIVGAGPAGLSAAYYLNKKGHAVTVFEKESIAGGQMTGGIPAYRLPTKDVLAEVQTIVDCGVELKCNCAVSDAAQLRREYDAVLVAVGTSYGKKLPLPGADLPHVYTALDVLRASRQGKDLDLGETVNIIGGGNVAFDVAGTVLRLGKRANVICLEQNAAQASPEERDMALEEGAVLFDSHSNEAIEGNESGVTGLRVHKINSFYFDAQTRALVEDAIPESSYVIPCDSIVFAAGQVTGLDESFGLTLNRFGYPINPETNESSYTTSVDGIFAAGDVITGTRFVIDAIQGAKECAALMDEYLGGDGILTQELVARTRPSQLKEVAQFDKLPRTAEHLLPPETRKCSFEPVSTAFPCDQASCEASRCLQCDLRKDISNVRMWTEYRIK